MQDPSEEDRPETWRERRQEASGREQAHAADEKLSRGKPPKEVGRKRYGDGLNEGIAGDEPLRGGGAYAQIEHDGGQRRGKQGLVEGR